jgi:leader peptidase (prepilin peptidase)/N-methyltransferase
MHRVRTRPTGDAVARVGLAVCLVVVGWRAADGELSVVAPLAYLGIVTGELCRIDVAELRLPNALVVPGLAFAIAGALWAELAGRDAWLAAVAWGAGYATVLLAPALAGSAGMGDVKLAAVLGLVLGPLGPGAALLGSVSPFLAAGAFALVAAGRSGVWRDDHVAFGPFMLGGFWGAVALSPIL